MSTDDSRTVVVGEIVDETGDIVEEREYATWADLCEPPAVREVQLKTGLWVRYRPFIPLDKMAEIQRKASFGRTRGRRGGDSDPVEFMLLCLQEVMLAPKITNRRDLKSARKASSSVMMGVISDVIDTSTFDELQEELGEA